MSTLPKLPEAEVHRATWDNSSGVWTQYHDESDPLPTEWDDEPPDEVRGFYSGDQIMDRDAQVWAAAMEAAAQAAMAEMVDAAATGDATDAAYNFACEQIAAAIRELPPPDGRDGVQIHLTDMIVAHRDMIEAQQRDDRSAEVEAAARLQISRDAAAALAAKHTETRMADAIRRLMQVAHKWAAETDDPDTGRSDTLEMVLRSTLAGMTSRHSVEEAIRAAMNAAFEAAAIQCELEARKTGGLDGSSFYIATGQCARAIRSLKNDNAAPSASSMETPKP